MAVTSTQAYNNMATSTVVKGFCTRPLLNCFLLNLRHQMCGLTTGVLKSRRQGLLKGENITVPLTSCLTGLVCFINKTKNCLLSFSWFQTSQTGGQWYSDTSPFSIPRWRNVQNMTAILEPGKRVSNDASKGRTQDRVPVRLLLLPRSLNFFNIPETIKICKSLSCPSWHYWRHNIQHNDT